MNPFVLADCTTVDSALAQLTSPSAKKSAVKAGGIDLLDRMKNGIAGPERLINIRNIPTLRGVQETQSGVTLGPLVTLAEIGEHPLLREHYSAFSDAAGHAATPHIRNMATLGGNLLQHVQCWYYRSPDYKCLRKGGDQCFAQEGQNQYHAIFDNGVSATIVPSSTAVALVALNASVELRSAKGTRTVPLSEFYIKPEVDPTRQNALAPDELLTAVHIPKPAAGTRSAYQKYGEKESFDWPIADAAVVLEMQGDLCKRATIVLGAASPTPRRAKEAEDALAGKPITEANVRAAGKAAMQGATPLAMNAYKLQLFPVAIYRTVLLAAGKMERDPGAVG